jgi:hypothetical protein
MKTRTYYGWAGVIVVLLTGLAVVMLFPSSNNDGKKVADAPFASRIESAPFLDQPVPLELIPQHPHPDMPGIDFSHIPVFNSFADRLTNLQIVAQRTILYPDGFVDFIQSEDSKENWDKGLVLFSSERNGYPVGNTVRDYLTASLDALTLTWKYDSSRNAITTDFKWRRDDPRTSAQLMDVLSHTPSSAIKPLYLQWIDSYFRATGAPAQTAWIDPHQAYFWDHHKLDPDDAWRIAFDALLSKPENFPQVWKLRFIDDVRSCGVLSPSCVDNILAKPMRDDKGREHFLVINVQNTSFVYYLFDETGKFERGGLLSGNQGFGDMASGGNDVAWLDVGKTNLSLRSKQRLPNGSYELEATFILKEHGLVLEKYQGIFPQGVLGDVLYDTK